MALQFTFLHFSSQSPTSNSKTSMYKGIKGYKWNITTNKTTKPEPKRQIKQMNLYFKCDFNKSYQKFEMKCKELQQSLNKEVMIARATKIPISIMI